MVVTGEKNLLQEEGRTEGLLSLRGQNGPCDSTVSRVVKTVSWQWPKMFFVLGLLYYVRTHELLLWLEGQKH